MIDSNMSKVKTSLIALTAIMATLMIFGVTPAFAQTVEEIEMCYGYSETTLSPLGITSTFLTTNEEAGIWVKIINPPDDVIFKVYHDVNGVEKEYPLGYSRVDVIPMEGSSWGIAFATLDIDGKTPGFDPGIWTVKVFIDGSVVKIKPFSIIDYSSISSSIDAIREDFEAMEAENIQIIEDNEANNQENIAKYNELVEAYEDLEDSSVSEIRFIELTNDLEDLQDEYDDLVDTQGSTKSMMYGSIVVALIAVVVAVYFGLMKK